MHTMITFENQGPSVEEEWRGTISPAHSAKTTTE